MERFTKQAFLNAKPEDRQRLLIELAQVLRERLKSGRDFHSSVYGLVGELRALGHDLWNFDEGESDYFQVWAPNYEVPSGPGLIVRFEPGDVSVTWTEQ